MKAVKQSQEVEGYEGDKDVNTLLRVSAPLSKKSFFGQQEIVDYRARAGAGAAVLNSWSRAKMERLHNTGWNRRKESSAS